jgi:hypothetical protein
MLTQPKPTLSKIIVEEFVSEFLNSLFLNHWAHHYFIMKDFHAKITLQKMLIRR